MHFPQVTATFLSLEFVLLLCGIAFIRPLWPQKYYPAFVAVSSALVLALAAPKTTVAIGAITLGFLYPVHRFMRKMQRDGYSKAAQKWLLGVSVAAVVLLLLIFKVYRQFTLPWLGGQWIRTEVLALVGFSYFIFRAINFLHIQFILPIDERSPWKLLAYTLFPPTITSGPIQKFLDFQQQVSAPIPLSWTLVQDSAYRISRGYFRKAVLAFVLDKLVTQVLAVRYMGMPRSVLAITLLYLYFYFDFAGYSDIAIGFGLLLGIRVPENFRKPFLATTVSEFWRNWHITLVDWFRENFFIPLGGMQSSRTWAALLAFATMVLCGFWHGLTISFIAWGLWHGIVLFTEAVTGSKPLPPGRRHGFPYWSRVLWTNARVAFGCIFFLPDTATIFKVMKGFTHWGA